MVLHSSSSSSSLTPDKRSMAHSHSSSGSLAKFSDDPSFFGSVLDQLHAEQKGTIEALTCQVEFYRQREERARQELQTLRRCLPLSKDDAAASASVAKLASENRALGDELDALRTRTSGWDRDKARLERQKKDLEKQLKDAKHTLTGFSQAIEQLEIKMQRKEAEVQTKCLELEQQVRDKTQECEQLEQEVENLQTANEQNTRLRKELQAVLKNEPGRANGLRFSDEIKSVGEKINDLEGQKRKQELEIQELQRKLGGSAAELAAVQLEVERKNCEIKEIRLKLDNTANMLTLREELLSSDDNSRREFEAQRQELLALVSTLQREKGDMQSQIGSLHNEHERTRAELQAAKSRLSVKDHLVMMSTLRSEVGSLKERLRSEFMHDKECLKKETQSLKQELILLRGHLAEKDLNARGLEGELVRRDEKQRQAEYDIRQLQENIKRLETELDQSRIKYQQLQQCQTSLAEQLDFGFKELLNDEESAASAHEELEKLRCELDRIKKEKALLEAERTATAKELDHAERKNSEFSARQNTKIDDLYRQLLAKEEIITTLKNAKHQVAALEREKESWEGDVTDIRLRCESRIEAEVRKAENLRSQIDQLEQDKLSLHQQIGVLEEENAKSREIMHETELHLRQKDDELESMRQDISRLDAELAAASQSLEKERKESTICQQKLLNERRKMESEMVRLVHRIESAGQRNFDLGEKVIVLAKQAKVDQTDLIALSSQVKSYKEQVKTLGDQLGLFHRRRGNETNLVGDLQRKLGDLTCLKESYQVEIDKLQQMLEHVRSEYNVIKQQRDEAVKRVRLLVQSRGEMKTAIEDHTGELVEEIEALQHQMDNERKRCAVLLANEKTLLRDLQERNTEITKLQHTVSAFQRRQSDGSPTRARRRRCSGNNSVGTPVSSSNQSTGSTTSSLSPQQRHRCQSHHHQQQQPQQQQLHSSSTTCSRSTMTPTKEMEHLLSNLERISDFSAQVQQLQR
ncbi:hypothetical protein PHYBOEH_000944 [Phytophthora boehmeriae]|uniref:Uncharacterized protein n=1 Tax=Phytophthora boehmeriae TaxID=109152 RepID=A0A8T1X005_9STRA|nr:hypothetical protein PHYBOEH_000944 [Phytophthora boehmeriae]